MFFASQENCQVWDVQNDVNTFENHFTRLQHDLLAVRIPLISEIVLSLHLSLCLKIIKNVSFLKFIVTRFFIHFTLIWIYIFNAFNFRMILKMRYFGYIRFFKSRLSYGFLKNAVSLQNHMLQTSLSAATLASSDMVWCNY